MLAVFSKQFKWTCRICSKHGHKAAECPDSKSVLSITGGIKVDIRASALSAAHEVINQSFAIICWQKFWNSNQAMDLQESVDQKPSYALTILVK